MCLKMFFFGDTQEQEVGERGGWHQLMELVEENHLKSRKVIGKCSSYKQVFGEVVQEVYGARFWLL